MSEPDGSVHRASRSSSLRTRVVRGGFLLAVRQAISILVSALGFLVTARLLGPTEYGHYSTAFGIHAFVAGIAQAGFGVFLIRRSQDPNEHVFNVASTFLVVTGLFGALVEIFLIPRFGT